MTTHYYKSDNSFSLCGFISTLISTFVVGSCLSIPYLFLIQKIPYVYFNILLPIFTGCIIGFISGQVGKLTKFHSPKWSTLSITIGCVGFTIVKWAIYVYNLLKEDLSTNMIDTVKLLITHPSEFWYWICNINKYGTWGLIDSKSTVHGAFLWIVWIIEILLFFCFTWGIYQSTTDIPFITEDNNWATLHANVLTFDYFDVKAEKSAIEANPEVLLQHPLKTPNDAIPNVSLDVYSSADGNTNYISLTEHTYNKKHAEVTTTVISFLYIDKSTLENLQHAQFDC